MTSTYTPNATKCVAAGAAWLDRTTPGWYHLVDVAELEMSNPCRCIGGQVFQGLVEDGTAVAADGERIMSSGYCYLTRSRFPHTRGPVRSGRWLEWHGFESSYSNSYGELGVAWAREIDARRQAAYLALESAETAVQAAEGVPEPVPA
jgi:hypothetical protein